MKILKQFRCKLLFQQEQPVFDQVHESAEVGIQILLMELAAPRCGINAMPELEVAATETPGLPTAM